MNGPRRRARSTMSGDKSNAAGSRLDHSYKYTNKGNQEFYIGSGVTSPSFSLALVCCDVVCWTMCTILSFVSMKMWNWMHAWQVATASPWLAMYADEQQLSYHFMVFQKLFCIKVIWLKYLLGKTHTSTHGVYARTHKTHTQASTQATQPRTSAYARAHTRATHRHTRTRTHL